MNMTFETLEWFDGVDGYLEMIDQRRLPEMFLQMGCGNTEQLWDAIKTLAVRGAPAIGVAAGFGVCLAMKEAADADIPAAMGCKDWYTAKVTTLGELDAALAEAEKAESGVYIEIIIDRWAIPKGGEFMFTGTGSLFGKEGRTWEGWMKEMAAKKK